MPPTLHARLGASSSKRWMNCPGSIRMSEGIEDRGSPFAWEGTAAHEVGERALREKCDAYDFIGEHISVYVADGEYELVEVTEEMAGAVQDFVDYVRERWLVAKGEDPDTVVYIERQGSLEALNPPGGVPMFGTADVVIWQPNRRHMIVIDYKHGQGVVVEVEDNTQVVYYALVATVAEGVIADTYEVTIAQPRVDHPDGRIRSFEFDREYLIDFKRKLWEAAEDTQAPDAPLNPGSWCRFCPARGTCPARRDLATEVARVSFDAEPLPAEALPMPKHLTPEELAYILHRGPLVMEWVRDVESHALHLAQTGGTIPGFKLAEKRTNRRWKDEERAQRYLANKGLKKGERTKARLVSPAQAEKLLKARGHDPARLEKYWEKPDGGPKLVPSDDPRPALPAGTDAFGSEPLPQDIES